MWSRSPPQRPAGAGRFSPPRPSSRYTELRPIHHVYGTLRGGAAGFVLKDAGPALLVEAVRAAHAGDTLISPSVTVRLLRHLTAEQAPSPDRLAQPLSDRETEVARAIARSRTNQEIAAWAWENRIARSP